MYYAYILKSLHDKKYYYGSTSDFKRRLTEHNNGKVSSTKSRIPFIAHYVEEHQTLKMARLREIFFKKRSGYKWLKSEGII